MSGRALRAVPDGAIQTRLSPFGLDATLSRLLSVIERRRLRVFALIDHDGAAEDAGLELRPSRVVIFGSPVTGTPLMREWPLLALQLPLRILVWEGEDGGVRLSHLTTEALIAPVGIEPARAASLGGAAGLIEEALSEG